MWIEAIHKDYYDTCPGITTARVRKYIPKSEYINIGHMRHLQQDIIITKKKHL